MSANLGRVAIVTAANGGLGRATCRRLAAANVGRLFAFDIDPAIVAFAASQTSGACHIIGLQIDCADAGEVADAFRYVEQTAGRIDILVNGVAMAGTTSSPPFVEIDWSFFQRTIEVSLLGMALCARQVAPGMAKRKFGRIVNISSGAWKRPWMGASGYATAKAGVVGLTHALAIELAPHGITVNAVSPGPIRTAEYDRLTPAQKQANLESIPMGRLGEPEDVAAVIAFLASDESSYVTGTDIPVNGGRVLF